MWGALIGAALSIAGSVANGISSSKARKEQKKRLQRQLADNQAWYDRKYNEDPTKRASTQRLLTQMEEQIRDRNRAAKGRQAVMGGTEDSVTATKEANAKALADTTSNIVAQNDARKDAIEQQYQNRKYAIENQQAQNAAQEAEDKSKTFSSVLATAGNIASSLDSGESKAKKSNGNTAQGISGVKSNTDFMKSKEAPAAVTDDDTDWKPNRDDYPILA